jgi:hypothetical protein
MAAPRGRLWIALEMRWPRVRIEGGDGGAEGQEEDRNEADDHG